MRHGLLGLAILALMACVHAPQRPHESPPSEALSPAPPATPAPAVSSAPSAVTTDAAAASSSVSAASPEAASPETRAAQAAGRSPAEAQPTSALAPPAASTTAADATPAPVPAPLAAPAAPTLPPDASAAATDAAGAAPEVADEAPRAPSAQSAGLAPALYGDLFDRMRAGFTLEDGAGQHAVDQQLRWYANNPEYLQRAFGRAELYLYQIVTELERRGMPRELALLPVVESAFEPYAYSRARASGLWQFIPGTGSHYGLKQDWWYDGRRDIVESTRAALDYLQHLHDEFDGDWLLAVAAYNCGEAMVERAVDMNRAAHRPVTFWELWLPGETRAYVPKLLAMKRLVRDPEGYGLEFSPIPNSPYFARIATHAQVNLKIAAGIAAVSAEELYGLDPAFQPRAT